jgi:hypothetical protein
MVYNTQNYWVLGLCLLSDILKQENTKFRKLDLCPSSAEGKTLNLLGTLERANLNHWTTHVSITTAI